MQGLAEVPIMLLTEESGSYRKPALKHHLKYLRRLKELRLARPLISAVLPDLQHFTSLNQLYLDRATDSLPTLADIPMHIKSPAPVSVILGLSATVPRPLYAARPEIHAAVLPVLSSDPLMLEHAESVEIDVAAGGSTLDFSGWPRLTKLVVNLALGADANEVHPSPRLEDLTLGVDDSCTLCGRGRDSLRANWSASSSRGLRRRRIVRLKGDLRGFTSLYVRAPTSFEGETMTNVELLDARYAPLSEPEISKYLGSAPATRLVFLVPSANTDYGAIARAHPALKEFHFGLAERNDRELVENIADTLKGLGRRTTASVSVGNFGVEEFDSDTGYWLAHSIR